MSTMPRELWVLPQSHTDYGSHYEAYDSGNGFVTKTRYTRADAAPSPAVREAEERVIEAARWVTGYMASDDDAGCVGDLRERVDALDAARAAGRET